MFPTFSVVAVILITSTSDVDVYAWKPYLIEIRRKVLALFGQEPVDFKSVLLKLRPIICVMLNGVFLIFERLIVRYIPQRWQEWFAVFVQCKRVERMPNI